MYQFMILHHCTMMWNFHLDNRSLYETEYSGELRLVWTPTHSTVASTKHLKFLCSHKVLYSFVGGTIKTKEMYKINTHHIDKVENLTEGIAQCIHVVCVYVSVAQVRHKLPTTELRPVFNYHRATCKTILGWFLIFIKFLFGIPKWIFALVA